MMAITDSLGFSIECGKPYQRIISLVPSHTELLFDLGLNEEVVGITKFCIHPKQWYRSKTRVGGTKNLRSDTIRSLQPQLIIANKEENTPEQVTPLRDICPVWTTHIRNREDALAMIRDTGLITGTEERATELIRKIETEFSRLNVITTTAPTQRAAYLIWKDPYMAAGGDTFIHDMMTAAGFCNVFSTYERYPTTSMEALNKMDCEWLLLSSEPYPFAEPHLQAIQELGFRGKILLVDGEMFSWYGSRMQKAAAYFSNLKAGMSRT